MSNPRNQRLSKRVKRTSLMVVLLPLVIAIALAAGAREFFLFAVSANPAINVSILTALVVGTLFVLSAARKLDREINVIDRAMAAIRAGQPPVLPEFPPSLNARMLTRLKGLGLLDGVMMPEGAIDGEIAVVRQELDKRHEPLQYIVGLMVALGLFGTFIGLLETLVSAAEVLSVVAAGQGGSVEDMMKVFSQMVTALKAPLVSMGTAFSASMFGLVGSIVIGMMVVLLGRFADRMLEQARAALFSISDANKATLAPSADVSEEFLARFLTDITAHHRQSAATLEQVLELSAQAFPAMRQVASSVELLAERMERHAAALGQLPESMTRLERLPEALDLANTRLSQIGASLGAQEASLAGLLARAQEAGATRLATFGELRALLETQVSSLHGIAAAQAPALDGLQRVADAVARHGELAARRLEEGVGELRGLREPLVRGLEDLASGVERSATAGSDLLAFVPGGVARLESALTRINERLAREEDTLRAQSEMLRADLDNEERRASGLRQLGDAVLTSVGGVEGVREELGAMSRGQRQLAAQLTDVLKGIELALGRMQDIMADQQLALRILQGPRGISPGAGATGNGSAG